MRERKVSRARLLGEGCADTSRFPQVKRFFMNVVQKGEFPGVSVNFIPGRTPEAVLFDADGTEVSAAKQIGGRSRCQPGAF